MMKTEQAYPKQKKMVYGIYPVKRRDKYPYGNDPDTGQTFSDSSSFLNYGTMFL